MSILWNYTGAVTQNEATAVCKLPYAYGSIVKNMSLYTIVYDGTNIKGYINGNLISESSNIEAGVGTWGVLYFGADYDDTCWLKGKVPQIVMLNQSVNDADRQLYENYLADKWLNTGTVLHHGYTVQPNLPTLPVLSDPTIVPLFDFKEDGIGDGVWESTGGLLTLNATVTNGKGFQIVEQKNKDCMYFDRTFLTVDAITGANTPDTYTLMFLLDFDQFDTTPYADGDGAQVLISSTSNNKLRIKKFNTEEYLGVRFRDWDGRSHYVDYIRSEVLGSSMVPTTLGTIKLQLGTSPESLTDYGAPITITNDLDYGIAKFNLTGLTANTTYYGVYVVNDVVDPTSAFKFKTLPIGPSSFKIVVGSCNRTGSLAPTWAKIQEENPDLFIHLGDLNYLDLNSSNKQLYAQALDISFSEPIKNLIKSTGFHYIYDNHDSLKPTVSVDDPNWVPFLEFVRDKYAYYTPGSSDMVTDGLYGAYTIGRVRFISLDCRRSRTQQRTEDSSAKTMLGTNQKAWFKNQLLNAKADPNIEAIMILSQVVWTADRDDPNGDSYDAWGASWASYPTERAEIANFIYDNQIKNVAYICADVHMQAIDDGRNSCYITDVNGDRIDPNTIDKAYWTPMLEASPFDQYLSEEGGPFYTSDVPGSGGGRYGSSEQSYGVVEVLDQGQNWIQIKMYTVALIEGVWRTNRYYTYNINCESGTPGTPPLLNWQRPNEINSNGYFEKDGKWRSIHQRYLGIDGEFKPQIMKWKFLSGKWHKIHDMNTHDTHGPISIQSINGWTIEPQNWIQITGKGFFDAVYPSAFGGYYELSMNAGDKFGNFPYGTVTGSPTFTTTENVRHVTLTPTDSIELPSAINVGITFDTLYNKDFSLGIWFHSDSLGYLIRDTSNTYGIKVESNGTINIKLSDTFDKTLTTTVVPGWNKLLINFKNGKDGIDAYALINGERESLAGLTYTHLTTNSAFILGNTTNTVKIANFYYVPKYNIESECARYILKPSISVTLRDENNDEFAIPQAWLMNTSETTVSFTLPDDFPNGKYEIRVESLDYKSNPLFIKIYREPVLNTPYTTNFKNIKDFKDNFFIFHKAWGGANGGVVVENIRFTHEGLSIFANGDLYEGDIQGVNRDGDPKWHTHPDDPKLGQPWTNRVGGVVVFKHKTGFGSYRVTTKIPTQLGVCAAFWTFFYNEIYPGNPNWDDYIAEGLHPQGTVENGYYMTRNHEIDIELPSHLDGGIMSQPSFNNMKCNTWIGELQNWDVPSTDPAYWEEYRDNLTPTGVDMYDGAYREFRFDWYEDRVEFYIDGVLKRINTGPTVPDIAGHFTFGLWFPSATLASKPWLVRPDRAWAGGTQDSDGGMKAMFDTVEMKVTNFSYTPFDNTNIRNTGETYPFGGYREIRNS